MRLIDVDDVEKYYRELKEEIEKENTQESRSMIIGMIMVMMIVRNQPIVSEVE